MNKPLNILSIMLCIILSLSACAKSKEAEDTFISPKTLSNYTVDENTITVYLPISTAPWVGIRSRLNEENAVYASQLLQNIGFNIEFKIYNEIRSENYKYFPDKFITCMNDLMGPVGGNPGIYVKPIQTLNEAIINTPELLEDFYDQAAMHAPNYLSDMAAYNNHDSLVFMALSKTSVPIGPAVLIRKDLYKEYGKEIRNAKQYETFLLWLKDEYPDQQSITTSLQAEIETKMGFKYIGNMAFHLFMPEMGYSSLACLFVNADEELDFPMNLWINNETGEIKAWHNIDEAQEALFNFYQWMENGLIAFRTKEQISEDNKLYPSLLVYSKLSFNEDIIADCMKTGALDLSQYVINTFPESAAIDYLSSELSGYYAAAGTRNIDATEYLRLMEALYNPDIYKYFMYGIEDVDYKIVKNDKGIERIERISNYNGMQFFNNSQQENHINPSWDASKYPENYFDEIYSVSLPINIFEREDLLYAIKKIKLYDFSKSLQYAQNEVHFLMEDLYKKNEPTSNPIKKINDVFNVIRGTDEKFKWLNHVEEVVNTELKK